MTRESLLAILQDVQDGKLSAAQAHEMIWGVPFDGWTVEDSGIGHYETL